MTPEQSHQHSLQTLNIIAEYPDFLAGITNICDMGAGIGLDAQWFTQLADPDGRRYNHNVTAVDISPDRSRLVWGDATWNFGDYSIVDLPLQDLIWCHDSFQYAISPLHTLFHWNKLLKTDGMLIIQMPYRLNVDNHKDRLKVNYRAEPGVYNVHTLSNLLIQLICAGYDCRTSNFMLDRETGWLSAAVYKITEPKMYANLHDMLAEKRLPVCLEDKIHGTGYFDETDLVVEWLDRSVKFLSL